MKHKFKCTHIPNFKFTQINSGLETARTVGLETTRCGPIALKAILAETEDSDGT